ncbi:hypothetical protein [Pseudomonas sp. NFX224]|uniref:hypothetical protein n=1 Tax=Pseudomonas sp. NFX224 TaxID=3402862 RepID=UPI003AFA415E
MSKNKTKSKNYLVNGNFSTGDFSHWTANNHHTPMSVELRDFNYVARLSGGRTLGQNLASDPFKTAPGDFRFSFNIQAPEAVPLIDSKSRRVHITGARENSDPLVNAFVVYTIWATSPIDGESEAWSGLIYVGPQNKLVTVEGTLQPGYQHVDVHLAIPNDPFGNKGPYYLDDIQFLMPA